MVEEGGKLSGAGSNKKGGSGKVGLEDGSRGGKTIELVVARQGCEESLKKLQEVDRWCQSVGDGRFNERVVTLKFE